MAEETNESFLNPSRRSYLYENSRGSGNRARVILIILGIFVLVALVAYAVIATGGKGEEELTAEPSPTEVEEMITPTPTPEEEEEEELTPTQAKSPTPSPTTTTSTSVDKASGLDRAELRVIIQNGGGVAGAATKASNFLRGLGYNVVSTGNADNFEYESTEISVKSTKKAYLDLLKKDLESEYTIGSATSDYTGTTADALVIVGQE